MSQAEKLTDDEVRDQFAAWSLTAGLKAFRALTPARRAHLVLVAAGDAKVTES